MAQRLQTPVHMENIQSAWRRLWVVFRNDTPTVFLILAFATLRGAFSLVLPLGFQALIGQLMGGRLSASWWVLFFVVLLFSGLMVLFGLVQLRISEWFQQRLFVRTAYFFERATQLQLPTLADEPSHRFFDTVILQKELPKLLLEVSTAVLQLLFGFLLLFLYDFTFVGAAVLIVFLAVVVLRWSLGRGFQWSMEESGAKFALTSALKSAESDRNLSLASHVATYLKARRKHFRVLWRLHAVLGGARVAFTAALLAVGGWLVIDQAVSIGQFVAIEIVFLTILVNLEKLISGVDSIFDILTALAKLDNTFQHEGVDISPFNPKDSQPVEGSAWLQNFSETHPPSDRRAPWRWMAFLAFTFFASLFLPWTQTVSMVGTVTMDNPMERPAALYAAENGRLSTWFVREGQVVRAGDTLMIMEEIGAEYLDPALLQNMEQSQEAKESAFTAYSQKARAVSMQLAQAREGMAPQLAAAQLKVQVDSTDWVAYQVGERVAERQKDRADSLLTLGVISRQAWETQQVTWQKARAQAQSQGQKWTSSRADYRAKKIALQENLSKLESALAAAQAESAGATEAATQARSKTNQIARRVSNRYVVAPRDGVVIELAKLAPGALVKKDEKILTVVPAYAEVVVIASCEPNDIPLMEAGQRAMVAFDGYPMLPIPGWPEHSVGMFEANVRFVSAAATQDGGGFAVVLEPSETWPSALRAGTNSHVTLLLKDVPLWFELWRQLNGLPANRSAS